MQQNNSLGNNLKSWFSSSVILIALIVSILIYKFEFGAARHFEGGLNTGKALQGDYEGIIYKGGVVVPILLTFLLIVITFSIERAITITSATGKGSLEAFLKKIKSLLAGKDIDGAINECNRQKGSVGNVVLSGLLKYKQVANNSELDKDEKLAAIQKELEESTSLELPMLERNLVIIATIASVATLGGLFGTVIGMIKAFDALAKSGTPDATELAAGISEALINTALGIFTSGLAIILYNSFTSAIDKLTYKIDEASFTISQDFAAQHSNEAKVTANGVRV